VKGNHLKKTILLHVDIVSVPQTFMGLDSCFVNASAQEAPGVVLEIDRVRITAHGILTVNVLPMFLMEKTITLWIHTKVNGVLLSTTLHAIQTAKFWCETIGTELAIASTPSILAVCGHVRTVEIAFELGPAACAAGQAVVG
jgi:hypothetical protein